MKNTTERIYKKDNPRAFKLGVKALQINLSLNAWTNEGVFQYSEDIDNGTEYITVEMSEDVLVFHVNTKYNAPVIPKEPKIIGKIDLPPKSAQQEREEEEAWEYYHLEMQQEEEELMGRLNLPMDAELVSTSRNCPDAYIKCYFGPTVGYRLATHEDFRILMKHQHEVPEVVEPELSDLV
jgi:hypothetical protein